MQERVNMVGLIRRARFQGWPRAGLWNVLWAIGCSVCLGQWILLSSLSQLCTNKVINVSTYFPSKSVGFYDCSWSQRWSMSVLPAYHINLGILSVLTRAETLRKSCSLLLWEEGECRKPVLSFLQILPKTSFPLLIAVRNHSCEYNCLWALWIFLENHWPCVWSWWHQNRCPQLQYIK